MIVCAPISARASMVGWMAGSKAGPLRWNPPTMAATVSTPVSALGVPDDVDDPGVFVADKDHQAVAGEEPIYLKLLRS
jgi:hypothetical protein